MGFGRGKGFTDKTVDSTAYAVVAVLTGQTQELTEENPTAEYSVS